MSDLAREIDSLPAASLRRQITEKPKLEPVEHPSGATVYAKAMSAKDYRVWQESMGLKTKMQKGSVEVDTDGMKIDEGLVTIAIQNMTDEHGERIFTPADREVVADMDLRFLVGFSNTVLRISGLGQEGVDLGNSKSAPPDASS